MKKKYTWMEWLSPPKYERKTKMRMTLQRYADAVARKHGYRRADEIRVHTEDCVLDHIRYGYRKNTTDEYVSHAYRLNFGWKNTYYQSAYTVVGVNQATYKALKPEDCAT